jgi:UDP-glucose 4-epimerase
VVASKAVNVSSVVLVTGVTHPFAARVARHLVGQPGVRRVLGLGPPERSSGDALSLAGVEYVPVEPRAEAIGAVLTSAAVDTVVHTGVPGGAGLAAHKETTVIGAMHLLAACQRATSVTKLVLCSTTAVYGASPLDPALFVEDDEPTVSPRGGMAKDAIEVEDYVRGFGRRRPDATVTVLRLADTLGACARSALARYFSLPVLPTVLGYDARLQVLHLADAVEVVRRAVLTTRPGVFNVAGDGVLLLSQAARRLGRPTLPVVSPALGLVGSVLRRVGYDALSVEHLGLLTYGRAVDTSALRAGFGYTPAYSTARAFEAFAAHLDGPDDG